MGRTRGCTRNCPDRGQYQGSARAYHSQVPGCTVPVAGRWDLDIKGEFVTVDHGVIISRAPTYPL